MACSYTRLRQVRSREAQNHLMLVLHLGSRGFSQAPPLFAFFVFMQLGNIAGPNSISGVLGMAAL